MNYRRLGRADLNISVVAIGTNQLRRVPERQAIDTLRRAFELGVNLVNAEPEYEGAYDLILAALREYDRPEQIHLSIQAGGLTGADMERLFEAACEKFGREHIDLFGITSIADQEAFGANVWAKDGLVEFLQRKKAEGRIRAIFASDHGSPEHTKEVLGRGVFDALMLAYNPLGFHLHTVRAKTVWQFQTPPVPIKHYELEDLPRTMRELLPLAKAQDVGVMLMKPLAGGLLCSGKAFPVRPWRDGMPEPPAAGDILRYLLANDAVTCVVPGMASMAEVEENAEAGAVDFRLDPVVAKDVETRIAALTRVLCSRCGQCDDLCSQGLPLSYLFRAAYHYLYPTAPFANSSALQYFKLYPQESCVCDTCRAQTCRCHVGIDIPGELKVLHRKMLALRDRGIVPSGDREPQDWATGRPNSFKILSQEIPESLAVGEAATVRLHLRNTGSCVWRQRGVERCSGVGLAVSLDGVRVDVVRLRQDVPPTQECHFAFTLVAPPNPGRHALRMDLVDDGARPLSGLACPPIEQSLSVYAGDRTRLGPGAQRRPTFPRLRAVATDRGHTRRVVRAMLSRQGPAGMIRRLRQAVESVARLPGRVRAALSMSSAAGTASGDAMVARQALALPPLRFAARYLDHGVPTEGVAGTRCVFRVVVENSGTAAWHRDPPDGHGAAMALYVDGEFAGAGTPSRDVVNPGEQVTVAISTQLPEARGTHRLRFEMLINNQLWFSEHGTPSLELPIHLTSGQRTRTEELLDIAKRRNTWFFSPGQTIHRSRGVPRYPVFADATKGCIVTDVDGREFVDVLMGWGCCLLGYGEERIQAAIARALATTGGVISLPHRLEIEVSEALCSGFSWGDEVLFGKNGSDVTTWAIRTARVATGRKTILFAGYHGWQDWNAGAQGFGATGVPPENSRFAVAMPYGDLAELDRAASAHAPDLAAIMIEPAHVCLDPTDTGQTSDGPYLARAEALARQHGALFILDEIMTGFRFRAGSAQVAFGLTPDLTCLGKALANGMPLSALIARAPLLRENIGRIVYAPTMKGEIYSFAAALEALRIYREEDVPRAVWAIGERIRRDVNMLCKDLGLDASLVGPPYRMNFLLHGSRLDEEVDLLARTLLQQELARHGVLSHRGYVIPSRAHDSAVDRCASAFAAALPALRDALDSGNWCRSLDVPTLGAEERPRTGHASGLARNP